MQMEQYNSHATILGYNENESSSETTDSEQLCQQVGRQSVKRGRQVQRVRSDQRSWKKTFEKQHGLVGKCI